MSEVDFGNICLRQITKGESVAERHPYISGSGILTQVFGQFRKAFPAKVNADTLKKFGFAPNNESYVISILRFIGLIDEGGNRTKEAAEVFVLHSDLEFEKGLGQLVEKAYEDLFDLHKENTWSLEEGKLITFFRQVDQSSALVGKRQSGTFRTLAALAGHGEKPPLRKAATIARAKKTVKTAPRDNGSSKSEAVATVTKAAPGRGHDVGLTVRIEINLPAEGDQETYDRIFRSIRENLIGGE
jgi:hypothetical protein